MATCCCKALACVRISFSNASSAGGGLVYEILPLPDAEKPAALAAYARARGFALSDEVIVYLLAHGRRDMRTLVATLAALDRRSLAQKRPVTVPLLREWLQRSIDDAPPG